MSGNKSKIIAFNYFGGSFIDKIEELAIFCEQSGGFRIR